MYMWYIPVSDGPLFCSCSLSRCLSVPQEGVTVLYSLHCWSLLLYSSAGPTDPSVPRAHGGHR